MNKHEYYTDTATAHTPMNSSDVSVIIPSSTTITSGAAAATLL